MNAHVTPPANVLRSPPRLRVVPPTSTNEALVASGIRGGKRPDGSRLALLANPKTAGGFALDVMLSAGTIDARQHAAGLAYAALQRRFDASGGSRRSWKDASGLSDEAWQAVKHDHAALIRAAGAERFVLDRLCLDGDAPLRCEVERVGAALDRLSHLTA